MTASCRNCGLFFSHSFRNTLFVYAGGLGLPAVGLAPCGTAECSARADVALGGLKLKFLMGGLEWIAAWVRDDDTVGVLGAGVPRWVLHATAGKDLVGSGHGRKANGEKKGGGHFHSGKAVMTFSTVQWA